MGNIIEIITADSDIASIVSYTLSVESHEIDDDSFQEEESSDEQESAESDRHYQGAIRPYMFEPLACGSRDDIETEMHVDVSGAEEEDSSDKRLTKQVNEWCSCNNCIKMPTEKECLCCQEIPAVVAKCEEADEIPSCMTLHPGFQAVATNPWNMQAVYNAYRQHHGEMPQENRNEGHKDNGEVENELPNQN